MLLRDCPGILGCCTQVGPSLPSRAVTAIPAPSTHPSGPATPSTVEKPPPRGMLRLSMTCAVLFNLFSLLFSIPLRFPPSFIIQWPRPLLGAGNSKDVRGEDGANWQDKLLARKPPHSCSLCTELLSTQTPAETSPLPGAGWGRWLPLQGPKVGSLCKGPR